ncbi:MAG: hypothetical protein IAG10_32410, partial [Planctomycetaceae bacterium]|nr:hypothetical protein [Planctomycetaceae bacterium]
MSAEDREQQIIQTHALLVSAKAEADSANGAMVRAQAASENAKVAANRILSADNGEATSRLRIADDASATRKELFEASNETDVATRNARKAREILKQAQEISITEHRSSRELDYLDQIKQLSDLATQSAETAMDARDSARALVSNLPLPPLEVADASKTTAAFEWYKKEHETLCRHFEEVWKSGALNLSYLLLLSVAILTFGSTRLHGEAALFLATLPLVGWYFVVFKIFRSYVGSIGERLQCIEVNVAASLGTATGHFMNWYGMTKDGGNRILNGVTAVVFTPFVVASLFFGNHIFFGEKGPQDGYIFSGEKVTKVELKDSELRHAIRVNVAPDEGEWNKRVATIERYVRSIEQKI